MISIVRFFTTAICLCTSVALFASAVVADSKPEKLHQAHTVGDSDIGAFYRIAA